MIDTVNLYLRYVQERTTLDHEKIRMFLQENDSLVVVDHVHGSTRQRPERILGPTACGAHENVILLRTDDDYLFGGVATKSVGISNFANDIAKKKIPALLNL